MDEKQEIGGRKVSALSAVFEQLEAERTASDNNPRMSPHQAWDEARRSAKVSTSSIASEDRTSHFSYQDVSDIESEEPSLFSTLLLKFGGQTVTRRQTVLQTAHLSVEIPTENSEQFILDNSTVVCSESGTDEESKLPDTSLVRISVLPTIAISTEEPKREKVIIPEASIAPVHTNAGQKPSWASLDHVQESGILGTITDKERKIQEAMYEIVSNEQTFYKSMDIVVNHFQKKLKAAFPANSTHYHSIQRVLFNQTKDLMLISDKLLGEFDLRQGDTVLMVPYFDILVSFVRDLFPKPFKTYSCLKQRQEQALDVCREDPKFSEVLMGLNKDPCTGFLTLDAFLLKPVQQVTRYALLLEALVSRLEPEDSRREGAEEAHQRCKEFAQMINRETTLVDFRVQLARVQATMKGCPSPQESSIDLRAEWKEALKSSSVCMFRVNECFSRRNGGRIKVKSMKSYEFFCWKNCLMIVRNEGFNNCVFDCFSQSCVAIADECVIRSSHCLAGFPEGTEDWRLLLLLVPNAFAKKETVRYLLKCPTLTQKRKWNKALRELLAEGERPVSSL